MNSLYALAWHTLSSTEEALLFMLCGEESSAIAGRSFASASRRLQQLSSAGPASSRA